jgi:hypothetical protein
MPTAEQGSFLGQLFGRSEKKEGRRKERKIRPGSHIVAKGKPVFLDGNTERSWSLQKTMFCDKTGSVGRDFYSVKVRQPVFVYRDGNHRQLRSGQRVLVPRRWLVKQR